MVVTSTDDADLWQPLRDELSHWQHIGRSPTFWWRDDDAERPTPQLRHLLSIAAGHPLVLAVVPAGVSAELADLLQCHPTVTVWQHGWSHANHAPAGQPDNELGDDRPLPHVLRELQRGRTLLDALFRDRLQPVLVPPWNRMTSKLVPHLPGIGISGLSLGAGRHLALRHRLVRTGHAQVDLSDWDRGGRFIGTGPALQAITAHLRDRRHSRVEPHRATGILTHHLVLDTSTAVFMERLLRVIDDAPAARWLPAEEVLHRQRRWLRLRVWCARQFGRYHCDTG